jgi:hypothetical protein
MCKEKGSKRKERENKEIRHDEEMKDQKNSEPMNHS